MTKLNRALVASALMMAASSAFAAGSVPRIVSSCVTFPTADIARVTGIVTDADGDAISVTPLVVGACLNGSQNVVGTTYTCDAPADLRGYSIGLVASDMAGNSSGLVEIKLELGCKFY